MSALVPDLDHRESMGKNILDVLFLLAAIFYSYSSICNQTVCIPDISMLKTITIGVLSLLGAYFLFFKFLKPRHRGITHSILFAVIYSLMVFLLYGFNLAIAGLVGYLSHLLADKEFKII